MKPIGWLRWLAAGLCWCVLVFRPGPTLVQEAPFAIQIDAEVSEGELRPVWSYFGYDEANYTCRENGKKLLGELRQLSSTPVYVRVAQPADERRRVGIPQMGINQCVRRGCGGNAGL